MNETTNNFFQLSPSQRRIAHEFLALYALGNWQAFVESGVSLSYRESVCGTEQVVDAKLPGDAIESVLSGKEATSVARRYLEPIAAIDDSDLCFPDSVEFAFYAIYNYFQKYALHKDIDDWLLVTQALSSNPDEGSRQAVLFSAIEKATS